MSGSVLVLRPQPGADRTVAHAQDMGFGAVSYPLFAVRPCAWDAPDPAGIDVLLITSANAVRHAGSDLARYRNLPAYAVGATTAEALRAAGFMRVVVGSAGVQESVGMIQRAGHAQVLHLSGADIRPYDPVGLNIMRVPVYESIETGDAAGLSACLHPDIIVLVHSPRAAMRLAQLVPVQARASIRLVAISVAALEAAGTGWSVARAVTEPTDKAMLALAATLCD